MPLTGKFTRPRPGQQELIDAIGAARTRFVLLSAPTGAGKSYIAAAAVDAAGADAVFLTATKDLQAQYLRDFPLAEIMGMTNYACPPLEDAPQWSRSAKFGPCHDGGDEMAKHPRYAARDGAGRAVCRLKAGGCPYFDARTAAAASSAVITNYAYWCFAARALGPRGFIVCDEAHALDEIIIERATTRWFQGQIDRLDAYGADTSFLHAPDIADAADGAALAAAVLRESADAPDDDPEDDDPATYGRPTPAKWVRAALKRLDVLAGAADAPGAVWEPWNGKEARFVDTTLDAATSEKWIWKGAPRILLMSATITAASAAALGIRDEDVTVINASSIIPAERRPTFIVDRAPWMNYHAFQEAPSGSRFLQWLILIDDILARGARWKGVIHTSSYAQARLIAEHSDHADRIITHAPGEAAGGAARFRSAPAGSVLVSPAVATGVDFPGDLCRYQIIAKVPWVQKTPVARALEAQHPGYLDGKAILQIVQQAGRSTRGPDDASAVFVIDSMIRAFETHDNLRWFPGWFLDAVEVIQPGDVESVLQSTVEHAA